MGFEEQGNIMMAKARNCVKYANSTFKRKYNIAALHE